MPEPVSAPFTDPFETGLSRHIWQTRYRFHPEGRPGDQSIRDTWRRVAHALAAREPRDREGWAQRFHGLLEGFRFLPGGRILAGAGTGRDLTLFNCFVMGRIGDSLEAIFEALKEGALTMRAGGGVGYDFSPLRPQGALAERMGGLASGPLSFMHIWDRMCATLLSTSSRRGAMMGTLRCDHPDIEAFIDAKRDRRSLRNFNLSVLVTDDFMAAVAADRPWPLMFPPVTSDQASGKERMPATHPLLIRPGPGQRDGLPGRVWREIPARSLWERLMRAAYETAEPGVIFVDRINRENNLWYREEISATNPCGEIPLPPYGACNLGSVNLVTFVSQPFTPAARLDLEALERATAIAVRMLDNVIDLSPLPLPAQMEQVQGTRRLGLGITGLADALIMLGLHYGSAAARDLAARIMRTMCLSAYRTSIALARERGPFPFFEAGPHLQGPFIRALPADLRAAIAAQGVRNSHLLAIAPAGSISLLANGVSSGLEPVFAFEHRRRIRDQAGEPRWHRVSDYALRHWRQGRYARPLPDYFVSASQLGPEDHLAMQAALQPWVDNAISKTINVPTTMDLEAFQSLFTQAYRLGLKGCTAFRQPGRTGCYASVLCPL